MSRALKRGRTYVTHWLEAYPRRMAFMLGSLMPLAYAPFYLAPIFFISYGLMFYLALTHAKTPAARPWALAQLGWLFGFGQFFFGLLWMGEAFLVEADRFLWALPFAVTLLPAGLALFVGAAFGLWAWGLTLLSARVAPQLDEGWPAEARFGGLILLAVFLALAAYARSTVLTGLPWNVPGMVFGSWLVLAQAAALIGVHGLSLLALLSAALLTDWLMAAKPFDWAESRRLALAPLILLVLIAGYGVARLATPAYEADKSGVHIAVIQPNIAQREKWLAEKREAHIDKIFAMTRLALDYAPQTDLVVWPEAAIPALIDEGDGFAERVRANIRAPQTEASGALPYILTGAVRRNLTAKGADYFNSAMLWSGDGLLLGRSDKHHLVPFGEYLPLQNLLEAMGLEQLARLRGGYHAGPPHGRLSAARLPLMAPLICYEAIFPNLAGGAPRPALLVNLTNDGWFGQWHGPYQHLAQARLRAIEQGLPLVRAANTGVSAVFDAQGRLLDRLGLGEAGSFSFPLPPPLPPTLYAHIGDGGFWALIIILLSVGGYGLRQRARQA